MSGDVKLGRVYLVDGSGYIFRAFHALPPLTRSDGTPTGAVAGFCSMLWKLEEEALGDTLSHLAVIFDAGRRTFRNDIYPDYKAHRPEAPPELVPQFALIREATRAFGLASIEQVGFEADDLIATYARLAVEAGGEVTIVSSDKDLMQLVGERVAMLDPIKLKRIGPAEVKEKFGVAPDKVVDVQALAGDSTDNVPGVPGIGVKTAAELIGQFGDLDTLLACAGDIRQPKRRETLIASAEKARLSRELVRLRRDVPVEHGLEQLAFRPPDAAQLLPFLEKMEFRRLVDRVNQRLQGSGELLQRREQAGAAPRPRADREADRADSRHETIESLDALAAWVEMARTCGMVALSVEADSAEPMRAELTGLALALAPGRTCRLRFAPSSPGAGQGSLPLAAGGGGADAPAGLDRAAALERLKPLLEDIGVLKIGHGIKFAIELLARLGVGLAPADDVMLVSYVLAGGGQGHGLDELIALHLAGEAAPAAASVPPADAVIRLHARLKPRLASEGLLTLYETVERPLSSVVAKMELAGIKVDREELRRLSAEFGARIAELEAEIHRLAGRSFNIGSPKQLGEVLFDEMGLAGGKKGKTGAYATGADVLEELAAQGHDLPARVLDWRQLAKLKNTYTDTLTGQIDPTTGRVHTSYALAATSTGRLSSTEPNLQNIPIRTEEGRKIRRAFVAEDGCRLLSVDYSQIELRLAADMAEVPALKQAFRDGLDIHAMTASQVFGVPIEGMDPSTRRRAKAINFGIIYGISPFGLAQQLGIAQAEAKAYIEAYFARYPGIRDYMERTKREARERGYVTTLFGRRCYVPGINDRNPARRSFMERAAINAPLQGTAADIIKRAMIRVPPALERAGLRARMLLQVHDELLLEVPEAEVDPTAAIVKQVMERATLPSLELSVPLVADAGAGRNWAEAH